jgi:phosphate starvation-inducible PhoH-like protein
MANDMIEVIPLAFMRGRTLNDSVIILDEAQNTTVAQMLMFLTRMGHGSKVIVTGDDSQIDLPENVTSGLLDARWRLKGIKGLAIVRLASADIVRHRLVQNIVAAYADGNGQRPRGSPAGGERPGGERPGGERPGGDARPAGGESPAGDENEESGT